MKFTIPTIAMILISMSSVTGASPTSGVTVEAAIVNVEARTECTDCDDYYNKCLHVRMHLSQPIGSTSKPT
jgi:hypothetical protein